MSDVRPIEPTAVYTVREAAHVTKLGENTLRKLAKSGEIKPIRVGKRVLRFLGSELLAFLHQGGSARPVNAVPDQVRRRPKAVA